MLQFHIVPEIVAGPYGGGNQFAKALRAQLLRSGCYTESIGKADVVLFNGYPFRDPETFKRALQWKRKRSGTGVLITRIDGPIASIRHNPDSERYDDALYAFSDLAADGVVVQSLWSLEQIHSHPLAPRCPIATIGNAPDPNIFYPNVIETYHGGKTRIIASSWSSNPHKGYRIYDWLDRVLDFSRFEFTVVASTDYRYQNIKVIPAMEQKRLADLLRASHVYITASRIESCSNASLEALHCGLPVVAPNASSHPEFMPSKDLLFDRKEQIPDILEKLSQDLDRYRKEIVVESIGDIAEKYVRFASEIAQSSGKTVSKAEASRFLSSYLQLPGFFTRVKTDVKKRLKSAILRT